MFNMDVLGHFPFNVFANYLRNSFDCSIYLIFVNVIEMFCNDNLLEPIMT